MIRATEVLPVPGGPRNTKCCMGLPVWYPACARMRAASTDAVSWWIWSLTPARPIIASSSATACSTVIVGRSRAGPARSGTPVATCCTRPPSASSGAGRRGGAAGRIAVGPRHRWAPRLLPAVDTAVLQAPGQAPAQDHGGEQPPDHPAEGGLAGGEP